MDDEIGIGITPGLALVASDCIAQENPKELRDIMQHIHVNEILGSTIQTALAVIDWYAVNKVGDQIAVAYDNDDDETLEQLAEAGFTFYPREDGTLDLVVTAEAVSQTPFPSSMWSAFNERLVTMIPLASDTFGVPERSLLSICYAISEEGVLPMRNKVPQVNISYQEEREKIAQDELAYSTAVACGLITHALILSAVEERNKDLAVLDMESIDYDELTETLRSALAEMLLVEE